MQMFFIAIVLPQRLNEKILTYKKWMHEKYGCKVGLKSPAHITLVPPFWTGPENEERLKADVQNISAATKAFPLATDHFSAFEPRTLFVAVEENENLKALKKATDDHLKAKDYKIKGDTRPFHPHITIATRDLHKKDFADAWAYFENKTFKDVFDVSGLSLLKHNGTAWDVVFTSGFIS